MGCAFLLWKLPGVCACPSCALHVNERTVKAEERRVTDHRNRHTYWHYEWGDPRCAQCKLGNRKDEPRD